MSDENTEAQVDKIVQAITDLEGTNEEVIGMLYEIQDTLEARLEALEAQEISNILALDGVETDSVDED